MNKSRSLFTVLLLWVLGALSLSSALILYRSYENTNALLKIEQDNSLAHAHNSSQTFMTNWLESQSRALVTLSHVTNHEHEFTVQALTDDLQIHLQELGRNRPDFAMLLEGTELVWADPGSIFYGLDTLVNELRHPVNFSEWQLKEVNSSTNPTPLNILINKQLIINSHTGAVEGTVIFGVVLNNNMSLANAIRLSSSAEIVSLRKGSHILASTEPRNQPNAFQSDGNPDLGDDHKRIGSCEPVPFATLKKQLQICLALSSTANSNLQQHLNSQIIQLLLLILMMSILVAAILHRKIISPVRRLARYAKEQQDTLHPPQMPSSGIREYDQVAQSLGNVVRELAEKETSLRNLFDTAFSPILVWTPDGIVTQYNEAAFKLRGNNPTILPLRITDCFPKEVHRLLDHAAAGHPIDNLEIEDGSGWWQWNFRPLFVDGQVRAIISQGLDITLRKRVENEMRLARDAAMRANQAKSDFLAVISHEIRTPMNGVIGNLQLLDDTSLNSEQKEYVDTTQHCANALLSLLNDVLDFSKIESGALELNLQETDLHNCIEDAASLFSVQAAEKRIELICDIDETVPRFVMLDSTRLRQILINLLGNAVKFTDTGEVTLSVRAERLRGETRVIYVDVTDSGIGIRPETRQSLFEPFAQGDASTTRRYGGTGLGLSICKRLVELMKGTIGVTSVPGEGSRFFFTLVTEVAPNPTLDLEALQPLDGNKVLVLDDNTSSRQQFCSLVKRWGMTCVTTSTLTQALQAIDESGPFQLYLLDASMPDMDAFALAQHLEGQCDQAPRILLSSTPNFSPALEVKRFFSTTQPKPVRQRLLRSTIVRLLSGEPLPASTPQQEAPPEPKLNYSVLVVEDNPINQRLASAVLVKLGCQVEVASDGEVALEICKQQQFDLVFMDMQMPVMDGLEATRRLRRFEHYSQTPVIALTANTTLSDRDRCLAAGMNDFISKPFKRQEIKAILKRWLAQETTSL
ncbi:response regulator [Pokkaliibacter sp. CJK22405]|uniref:response regulator n=1 Tax=Pokkaliibacter sp. CJK22405 TaxID=3384615 RepID=UPI0039848F15